MIVDCHGSRVSSFAIEYLKIFNITLITLLAHTTHILQPFDITVAKSLKSYINKFHYNTLYQFNNIIFSSKRAKVRYQTALAMIDSWSILNHQILRNGFIYSGIYPFDPRQGLNSKYVTDDDYNYNNNNIYGRRRNTYDISN